MKTAAWNRKHGRSLVLGKDTFLGGTWMSPERLRWCFQQTLKMWASHLPLWWNQQPWALWWCRPSESRPWTASPALPSGSSSPPPCSADDASLSAQPHLQGLQRGSTPRFSFTAPAYKLAVSVGWSLWYTCGTLFQRSTVTASLFVSCTSGPCGAHFSVTSFCSQSIFMPSSSTDLFNSSHLKMKPNKTNQYGLLWRNLPHSDRKHTNWESFLGVGENQEIFSGCKNFLELAYSKHSVLKKSAQPRMMLHTLAVIS